MVQEVHAGGIPLTFCGCWVPNGEALFCHSHSLLTHFYTVWYAKEKHLLNFLVCGLPNANACGKTPLEIGFIYFSNKDICFIFNTRCIISVFIS
jgi:hypothetical protein